jgi:hypothetical protein
MRAQQIFARAIFTVRIMWGALTFSCVLLGVVTVMVPSPVSHPPEESVVAIFSALGFALAIASFVVPARVYASNVARVRVEKVEPEPTPAGPGPARFAQPELAAGRAMGIANTSFILSMALSEAVGLLGLVLHMQGASMAMSSTFIGASVVLAAVRFPSIPRLVAPFERAQGASFAASEGGSY